MLLKVKKGKRAVWEAWCKVLNDRKGEALETLKEEDLVQERCLLFGEGDESYVLYMHKAVEGKIKLPSRKEREMNRVHFEKFHECLERIPKEVVGYDFSL